MLLARCSVLYVAVFPKYLAIVLASCLGDGLSAQRGVHGVSDAWVHRAHQRCAHGRGGYEPCIHQGGALGPTRQQMGRGRSQEELPYVRRISRHHSAGV